MSGIDYLKEKWITYSFIALAFLFFLVVYKLDNSFRLSESNAQYIMAGWGLIFIWFIAMDYGILNSRMKKMKRFCETNISIENAEDFFYPVDRECAAITLEIFLDNEKFKSDMETKSAEEMEFITRWLHDVKVPISAAKMILENHEMELPGEFYKNIYVEMFSVEESIQRVFYEMKTNRFLDDYKITRVSTKKLIGQALKSYSNFFSYKKINISIEGEDALVLTDEKWSEYILSQIISNGVKYSPYGGSLKISTSVHDNETTISIENKGKGIMKMDIGQVFMKGYTSSDNRAGMKATGYGLYLSKKLSDLLGHRLAVESTYNEYARFSLTFIEGKNLQYVTKM